MHATAHAGITLESIPAARPELVTGRRHKPEGCSKAGQFCIFHPQFLSDAPRKLPDLAKWSTFTLGVDKCVFIS